jgi:hypothetical protein
MIQTQQCVNGIFVRAPSRSAPGIFEALCPAARLAASGAPRPGSR